MTTLPVHEQESASDDATMVEADRAEAAREEAEGRKRAPVYHVFEYQALFREIPDGIGVDERLTVGAWVEIGHSVNAPTDRKAIEKVIADFDDDRRLNQFCAVLTRHWEPRRRVRTVHEDWA